MDMYLGIELNNIEYYLQIMLSQYCYAKVQTMQGQEYYLHTLPGILGSKRAKDIEHSKHNDHRKTIEVLPITNIIDTFYYHAALYYHQQQYLLIALSPLLVNGVPLHPHQPMIDAIRSNQNTLTNIFNKFIDASSNNLNAFSDNLSSSDQPKSFICMKSLTKVVVVSSFESEIFYFCLPSSVVQRSSQNMGVIVNMNKNHLSQAHLGGNSNGISSSKVNGTSTAEKQIVSLAISGSKWSNDDHEQLKKLLLQYGYSRWKQIQRSSSTIGGKLDGKPLPEIKAYANSFLRALALSLPEDQTNLKIFLQKLIEENQQEFNEYQPGLKQWDQHIMLPQRSVQYTKRLQLLNRVKTLIRKYREESLKNMIVPDRRKINWDGLLNFIPLGLLFGQRPAVWWAKKNDIDLLLGVYKYGYANYVSIRNAKEYCFAELQRQQTYQDFPVADNLTRRLKKLINTIVKMQLNQGEIDFEDEAESEEDEKSWSDNEKKILFNIVTEHGVPIGSDNKSNWVELKDKVKNVIKDFAKTPSQVEKMVSRMRWNCQEIISDEKMRDEPPQGSGTFKLSFEMAAKFSKNINLLQFIRRTILMMEGQNIKLFFKEVEEKNQSLGKDHAAYIEGKVNDQLILNHANKNGVNGISSLKLSENKILARIEWLCEVYKAIKEKVQDKKKKSKTFDESTKKKAKFELNRDKEGNIKFPININPSLVLVATGDINVNPNYHSEHNLFPVGYISIRTHASMFSRGVRARYTCQILEGDGKPIYKVTPEEDPSNPIIKDSSTGCWVYICNRVNQLQEVKKEKVTISGTQRFGLLEQNVVRLLEDLENSEKCTKYKFKKNLPKDQE